MHNYCSGSIIKEVVVKKAVLKLNNTDSLPIIRKRIVRIKL